MARKKTNGARDEFPADVKELLSKRVGVRCSNPDCRQSTSGPQEDPTKTLNIGVAAHITAAAPGGPRYDANLTEKERRSAENGIWLCQNCAKLVDNDEARYTVDLLHDWQQQSVQNALLAIESPHGEGGSESQAIKKFLDALQEDSVAPHHEAPPDAALAGIISSLAASLVEVVQGAVSGDSAVPRVSDLQLGYDPENITLNPPPLVRRLCERKTAVEGIAETLHLTRWLSIRGESGCGKTQLSALLARQYAGSTHWIRFRDLNSQQAAVRLDFVLTCNP